ncbi:MAG TPA: hypothetical protein VGV92_04185 [Gammaproteobacteria bacterium]|nr:hypothetical protein [Gammaproteobacteria bacterium]
MIQPVISQDIITWALIIVSIILVGGITYVYTNKNKPITYIFTVLSIFIIALIKLIGLVHIRLASSFIGGYNENNIAYVISQPGWNLLLDAWHIWILPVAIVAIIAVVIIICTVYYKISGAPKIEVLASTPTPPVHVQTSSEKLSAFMAADAAKKASHETHEKLAEALLANASYEIKLSDMGLKVRELERQLSQAQHDLKEEVETLELELKAKTKENQYIIDQLGERTRELNRAQEMFEKLMALHKQEKSS